MEEQGVRTAFRTFSELRTSHLISLVQDIGSAILNILATTLFKLLIISAAKFLFFSSVELLPFLPSSISSRLEEQG